MALKVRPTCSLDARRCKGAPPRSERAPPEVVAGPQSLDRRSVAQWPAPQKDRPRSRSRGRSMVRPPSARIAPLCDDRGVIAGETTFAWKPSAEQLEQANVVRLARPLGCADYASLH